MCTVNAPGLIFPLQPDLFLPVALTPPLPLLCAPTTHPSFKWLGDQLREDMLRITKKQWPLPSSDLFKTSWKSLRNLEQWKCVGYHWNIVIFLGLSPYIKIRSSFFIEEDPPKLTFLIFIFLSFPSLTSILFSSSLEVKPFRLLVWALLGTCQPSWLLHDFMVAQPTMNGSQTSSAAGCMALLSDT